MLPLPAPPLLVPVVHVMVGLVVLPLLVVVAIVGLVVPLLLGPPAALAGAEGCEGEIVDVVAAAVEPAWNAMVRVMF